MTTWKDWTEWYGNLFGLTTDRDIHMLAFWVREFFSPRGFTPADLKAAGLNIALNDPPRYRELHLARLLDEVQALRASARQATPAEDWTRCRDCGGCGLVSVPTPESRTRGATLAVICPCEAGRAFAANTRPDWMTLEQYEARWPFWRDAVREREEQERGYQRARGLAQDADRELGAIVAKIAGRKP